MTLSDSFRTLMPRVCAGEPAAAAEVYQRFASQLIVLARQHLAGLCAKLDPEDILQSAFRSFFVRCQDGRLEAENWDHLWSLLAVIAVRKCHRQREHWQTARRDLRREVSLEDVLQGRAAEYLAADGPTPPEAVALADLVAALLQPLAPRDRSILALFLQGFTYHEIAGQVGCSARTVRRMLGEVRRHALQLLDEEDAPS